MILSSKKKYLQVALNSTLEDARKIISLLPTSDRIIVEAGTPFIKQYGMEGVRLVVGWVENRYAGQALSQLGVPQDLKLGGLLGLLAQGFKAAQKARLASMQAKALTAPTAVRPYVVADLKTMDRGAAEVTMAKLVGCSAAIALGSAPKETLNEFIATCHSLEMDAMVDMMNVEYPLAVLANLKHQPDVILLHRGVDEEKLNKEKMLPLHEIRRIKSRYDTMISIAGGDSIREAQRSIFNDCDIVVIWKSVYQAEANTLELINEFLHEIK